MDGHQDQEADDRRVLESLLESADGRVFEMLPAKRSSFHIVNPEEAHSRASFWRACRLCDIWQSRSRNGLLPSPEVFNGFTIGFSLLPYVSLYDKADSGYRRRSPANDTGKKTGADHLLDFSWEQGFQRVLDLSSDRRDPVFFSIELGMHANTARGLDGVILPLATNGQSITTLCGCMAPR